MAESALRAYLKEIDELIEHNQLDEAIAHCRHILETYPKHLDTYRLLGKAYLEAKRYGDAADIFQRVLSAVPDDFVSHVGMSIVREDEGNTDAAIWHMERAFETNPANPAIQQELRRLIGRRDGIEPHKVRLTRGALARMYAHGELFPQAVAELRAALQEDPERTDLLVVLADMYWRTGQRSEAVEVCNRIIEKLPYCREANRILAAAYQASGRNDQAAPFHRRLASLDPYFAFVESAMADPQTVDPSSVCIDRLIWEPGQAAAAGQPVWASSLGVDLATQPEVQPAEPTVPLAGPIPAWLKDLGVGEAGAGGAPEEKPAGAPASAVTAAPTPPDEIPDWMREAGWQPATGEAQEGPVSFSDEDLAALEQGMLPPEGAPEGELAPGEIPEWLKAVAPKEITEAASAAGAPPLGEAELPIGEEGGPLPAWLQDVSAEAGAGVPDDTANVLGGWAPTPLEPEVAPEAEEPEAGFPESVGEVPPFREAKGVPTWIEESAPGATDTIVAWLGDRPGRERVPTPEELPEWMREPVAEPTPSEPEAASAAPPEASIPAWLSGVAEAAAQQEPVLPEEVPWLQEAEEAEEAEAPGAEEWTAGVGAEEFGEAAAAGPREPPEWLRGIVEPGLAKPGEPSAPREPPEWLREAIEPMAGRRAATEEPQPDWLKGLAEPELAAPAKPAGGPPPTWLEALREGVEPPQAMPEEADWLRGIAEPEPAAAAEPADELRARERLESLSQPESLAREEAAGAPAWLEGLEVEGPGGEAAEPAREPEMFAEPEAPAPAEAAAEEDVLQWLESLAASQGAPEAEAAVEPYAAMPEAPIVEERALPEEPAESLEWLERLAAERGIEAPFEETTPAQPQAAAAAPTEPAEEALPSWMEGLPGIEAEQPAAEAPAAELEEAEGPPAEAEVPVWKKAPIIEPPTTPLEVPDWLIAAAREEAPALEAPPTPAAAIEQAPAESPEVPEWLEEIAAEAEEGEAPPAALPEERIPTGMLEIPEWLKAAAAEEAPAETEAAPPEPTAPAVPPIEERIPTGMLEVPEWLKAAAEAEAPPEIPVEMPEPLQPVSEEPFVEPAPEPGAFEVPEWLTTPAAAEPTPEEPRAPTSAEVQAEVSKAMPEWLRQPPEPVTPPAPPPTRPPVVVPSPQRAAVIPSAAIVPPPAAQPAIPMAAVAPAPAVIPRAVPAPPTRPPASQPAPAQPPARLAAAGVSEALERARRALAAGDIEKAAKDYGALIRKKHDIPPVIEDLRAALARDASLAAFWQILGDAYMKLDMLPEAIDAYRRGLEAV